MRTDGTPAWWKGDDDAAASAMATARAMGFDVSRVTAQARAGV